MIMKQQICFWFLLKSLHIISFLSFEHRVFTPGHFDDSLKGSMMKVLSGVSDPKQFIFLVFNFLDKILCIIAILEEICFH